MTTRGGYNVPDVITDRTTGRRISLLDTQAANRRASWALFLLLAALLASIGYLAALAFDASAAFTFVGIALAVAAAQSVIAWRFSDSMTLAAAGARRASREEQRTLVNLSEAVAIGAGVPPPRIFVVDAAAPNAFATGRDPQHAAIAVTSGLLDLLDREELEGVIAHEMAHIRNLDVRFMSFLAATVGAIVLLRDVMWRWARFGRRRTAGGAGGRAQLVAVVALVVLMVVAPLLAMLVRLAVSRRREYLADATGAYITRNPEGLARALSKLRDYRGAPLTVSEGLRHMFIVHPLRPATRRPNVWATHPPIDDRIDRLRRM